MSLESKFESAFGRHPAAEATAPGRVNLIGEHIDYNGGTVLPAALGNSVKVALAPTNNAYVSIQSSRFSDTVTRSFSEPPTGHWSDYAIGAVQAARECGWVKGGIDLLVESDVPDGAGVSSSAALVTALLRGAARLANISADPVDIAKQARAVENDYIGMPCGIMDQMAVGLAEPGVALALDTSSLDYELINIPTGWRFMVVHSGVRRSLSDGRYAARFKECEEAQRALGTKNLCHLTTEQRARGRALPAPLNRRVAHVVSEHQRVIEAIEAMRNLDAGQFGALMNESHTSYAGDFEASVPDIEAVIESARRHGALGARLTGGGFGGCVVALVQPEQAEDWLAKVLDDHPSAWPVDG